ncbi:PCYCGC domain-containing protein [Alkalihalobacillus oceani]|uniref:PCYCGC domain-containing protein n=1 Tax=Halalkalibacter oceani TaxID=1653776 RepID=A0A9X2IME2_9BACI|nr:PCYCGC domain-containing protein [Halalkalibacter oceani]MCM3712641.1 PCYCGC domain-containing protein [Halalkalibacter oceani]
MKKARFVLAAATLFLFGGCQSTEESHSIHTNELGDVREATVSPDSMPEFLTHYAEPIGAIYARVPDYQNVLEQMPCYCGCGESAGHRSSYDCFIYEHQEDGGLVWDDHGARCGVCLEIAHFSMELYDGGASLSEIRQFVDERYEEGFAKPTPTPQPEAAAS